MSIAASGDGFTSSEDEGAVGLPPSGVVATAAPDPELTAMLARAAVSIGLEVNRQPSPEPSRLNDWFLGAGRGSQPRPAPVPFFPEVHEELTSSWMAPSRPEAARPPPPSSLPSTAEWPGGTRAFPRWRERSRCTCAHETPPLGGTVRVSRPRPVSWQPLSRPKLTVLRARQPPPCTPWLSCRFTKPRRSNRCTRVVPTRGWCRSCARRLTSLYERRKSRRGPSGRRCPPWWSRSAISGSTWQRWRTSTKHAFSTPPSPREGCSATPSRASPSSSRGGTASRPRRSSTSAPAGRQPSPRCPRGQAAVCPSPWEPSCVLQSCFRPKAESTHRPVRRALSQEKRQPPASQPGPKSSRKSTKRPWRGSTREMLELCSFSGERRRTRSAPSLPVEGPGGESSVPFCFCSAAGPRASRYPPSQRKRQCPFPLGFSGPWDDSVRRPAILTLAHDPFCQ